MKIFIYPLLLVFCTGNILATSECTTEEYCESYQQGRLDAESMHSTTGWAVGSLVSGLLLGSIDLISDVSPTSLGSSAVTIAAIISSPEPSSIPEDVAPSAYLNGYTQEAHKLNIQAAVLNSAIGSGILLGIAVIVNVLIW